MVTTDIDPRAVEFLLESNAIEGITNIDYRDSAHRQPGRGHWGALLLMLEAAHQYPLFDRQEFGGWGAAIREVKYRPLTLDDICTWQRMSRARGSLTPKREALWVSARTRRSFLRSTED